MVEALLLGLVAFIAQSEYALGTSLISRPIVTGLLTGLVLGDVQTGVIMGATLELAFIGSFSVGASIPPDVVTGGILGVAFAITSGAGTETALLLGLPIATLTLILKNVYLGMFIPMLSQKADGYAERADNSNCITCKGNKCTRKCPTINMVADEQYTSRKTGGTSAAHSMVFITLAD